MSLQTGTIVRYTPGSDGVSFPAIVFREWAEGTVELYVFHFDSGAHVRAAQPSQVEVMLDPSLFAVIVTSYGHLVERTHALEEAFDKLKPLLERLRELAGDLDSPPQPIAVDASEIDAPGEETAPVGVESTAGEEEPNPWKKKGRK